MLRNAKKRARDQRATPQPDSPPPPPSDDDPANSPRRSPPHNRPRPPPADEHDDVAQQIPNQDMFDALSPLDPTPSLTRSGKPSIRLSIPSSLELGSDWDSTSWVNRYEYDTTLTEPFTPPLAYAVSPLSDNEFTIHSNLEYRLNLNSFPSSNTQDNALLIQNSSPSAKMVGAGVANLGNTCFMGAILQCFTHTVLLVQGLRSCTHGAPCDADGFCVICALLRHINTSLANAGRVVAPTMLVHNLSYFSSGFEKHQQQDAHEFMQCVLDKLRKCFTEGENNLVQKVFGGSLISKLRCTKCGHSSDTHEPLIDLSLEIDENVNNLQDALESFTKVEKIDDKFKCASCKEDVSMEKQLMLNKAPSVAAFHLKRFKKDGISLEKIVKYVEFPLELDLQPYTYSNSNDNALLKYDLYAIVVHVGTSPNVGHYFCFVRSSPNKWHRLDDEQVTSVTGDLVMHYEAYILFYARQGTPWFSSIMEGENSDLKIVYGDEKMGDHYDPEEAGCVSDSRDHEIYHDCP